jgi:phosphonoacetate hydrolase
MSLDRKLTRRELAAPLVGLAGAALLDGAGPMPARRKPQRSIVVLLDGFGPDYFEKSDMPTLKRWAKQGIYQEVRGVMPSVTNANNASLCCGVPPSVHGITGNSFLNEKTGEESYMEDAGLLLAPTLFERAAAEGVGSALLSSKKKTVRLLRRGASLAIAAEEPEPSIVEKYGAAPPIYSAEIDDWLWKVAIDLLKTRPDLGVVYVHTTDYPMHMWPSGAPVSMKHLAGIDARLAEAAEAAPDAAFYITADHGLNHKTRAWDLDKACRKRGGLTLRASISAEKDRYPKHHRGLGGTAWVYLNSLNDSRRATEVILGLEGVEDVLTRIGAARQFDLMPSRIGDLVVLGDRDTVFGELASETEPMASDYRTHGSMHEAVVPLFVHNAESPPEAASLRFNYDVAKHLFPKKG